MNEIWKDIPGYEGLYKISDIGRVISVARIDPHGHRRKARIMVLSQGRKNGYLGVTLSQHDIKTRFDIHRLVLISFFGSPPAGTQSCHNDGNVLNCRLNNLRWDTRENNQRDKYIHGTDRRGERAPNAKLTANDVLKIRDDMRTQAEIARQYGIHKNYVTLIKHKKRWSHI